MNKNVVSSVVLIAAIARIGVGSALADEGTLSLFESPADLTPQGRIDELVFGRLERLGIEPARLCSDGAFIRRVYLDLIGTLPTALEAREFLDDRDPDKRHVLIDRLLERDEFADYWAMKWGDLLRVKAEFPINLWPNAAQAYHRWILTSIRENLPYDQFVREMLMANGSNFREGQVNFYRAVPDKSPRGIAQAVALAFMGARAEKWPTDRLAGMAAFFSQISYTSTGEWKEEIVTFDPSKAVELATDSRPTPPVFPDGTPAQIAVGQDPRAVFADWLMDPKNPALARNIANRVWFWLLGRGVIHEPDDIRPDNPPSHPELLAYLEEELVEARYDLKHLYAIILNSNAYQLSSVPRSDRPEAAANFASYPLRRLEAEVLIDALDQITGTTEQYSSPIPEPFTYIPEGQRSISLPDGSITSPFLEMFGRPPRDTGLESERSNRPTADQRLHMLNSSHIQRKVEASPNLQALFRSVAGSQSARNAKKSHRSRNSKKAKTSGKSGGANRNRGTSEPRLQDSVAAELYLTILSRFPTAEETEKVTKYFQSAPVKRDAAMDFTWALINSAEFCYRH